MKKIEDDRRARSREGLSTGTNLETGWEKVRALRIWVSARSYKNSSDTDGPGKQRTLRGNPA